MSALHVHWSNRIDALLDPLGEKLYASKDPFSRRLVFVPHTAMRQWLQRELAKKLTAGCVSGVDWMTLEHGLVQLGQTLWSSAEIHYPSEQELSFALEKEVEQLACEAGPLQQLLCEGSILSGKTWSRKQQRQITRLARQLARLFTLYGRVGGQLPEKWFTHPQEWQQELWSRVFHGQLRWSWPTREWGKPLVEKLEEGSSIITVFGVDFLDTTALQVLQQASKYAEVHVFALSACQYYWEDLLSDKELSRTRRQMERKGASETQQEALETLLLDRNLLLANWGRLGRRMINRIESSTIEINDYYQAPRSAANDPCYTERLLPGTDVDEQSAKLTVLDCLQNDALTLRNPAEEEPVCLPADDNSIKLLCASSRLREIEIVYQELLELFHQQTEETEGLQPSEISVLAPDMTQYRAQVDAVFGARDSQLGYRLVGMSLLHASGYAAALVQLLDLAGSRWEGFRVLQLFSTPFFQAKHRLTQDDVLKLRTWMESAGIYWGTDYENREDVLQRAHCSSPPVETSEIGTWKHGLSRLLRGLALSHPDIETDADSPGGTTHVDSSDSDLLGKVIGLLKGLYEDLSPLTDGTKKELSEWSEYVLCLADGYLSVADQREELQAVELTRQQVRALATSGKWLTETHWTFDSVKERLLHAMEETTVNEAEGDLQVVRFATLRPGTVFPAKVIVLLGMHDGAFPRIIPPDPLNMLEGTKLRAELPSISEIDRYLFLQSILSARLAVRISYLGLNPADGKEQSPSLVVAELLNYLDSSVRIDGHMPSSVIHKIHPFYAFDPSYFVADSLLPNYSHKLFLAAQSSQTLDKVSLHSTVPEWMQAVFQPTTEVAIEKDSVIPLQDLVSTVSEPLRVYCNQTLGLYLCDSSAHTLAATEPFDLSTLERHRIKQSCLNEKPANVLTKAYNAGKLPYGQFGEVARQKIQVDVQAFSVILEEHGVNTDAIFTLHLDPSCTVPEIRGIQDWVFPALKIPFKGYTVTIVGRIPQMSSQALLFSGAGESSHYLARAWPRALVLALLRQRHEESTSILPTKILFLDDGKTVNCPKDNVEDSLERLIAYYLISRSTPVPVVEDWLADYTQKSPNDVQAAMKKKIESDRLFRPYFLWGMSGRDTLPLEVLASWRSLVQRTFEPLFMRDES